MWCFRILLPLLLWMMGGLLIPSIPTAGAEKEPSLVPREAWIMDFEARLALARLLSYRDDQLAESALHYQVLLEERPRDTRALLEYAEVLARMKDDEGAVLSLQSVLEQDPDHPGALLALARVYVHQQDYERAAGVTRQLIRLELQDPEQLTDLADLEAALGHARNCRDLYQRALSLTDEREKFFLRFADRMNMWGDFYRVETVYRDYLRNYSEAFSVRQKLAQVLVSSQRYEEAEGLYRRLLLERPRDREAFLGLARLKLVEKDFKASLDLADRLLEAHPEDSSGLLLKGEIFLHAGLYDEAVRLYNHMLKEDSLKKEALTGLGKVYLKRNERSLSRQAFEAARRISPRDVEILFHLAGDEQATSRGFLDSIMGEAPMRLVEWGRIYASYGHDKAAVQCLERSLARDSECFPARMALAEILGVDHQYERSIELFRELEKDFPDNSKILISLGRVLGWSRQYQEALAVYAQVHRLNPADPLPLMESARTAVWGKMMDRAMGFYRSLWEPPVDGRLLEALDSMAFAPGNEKAAETLAKVRESCHGERPFNGYEVLSRESPALKRLLPPGEEERLKEVLLELLPQYRIQKSAYLESTAKWGAWNRRFASSMEPYEELIAFRPGNEEALFDYAQVQCALGLCDGEGKTYERILAIDALHNLAGAALERQRLRSQPSLRLSHSFWEEEGRGDLARIVRHRTDTAVDIPVLCQYHLRITGHRWLEDPKERGDDREAYGGSIEAEGILTPAIRAALGYTRKDYRDHTLQDKNLGYGRLWINLKDYARLGLGYERTDELYNDFGIRQGIQADQWWASLSSHLTRQLEVEAEGREIRYTDDNEGRRFTLKAGYAFTDHPRIFKITGTGEYRDTKHGNVYQYRGAELVDITHPYWTPEDYYGATLTVEWYHDLSSLFVCGSELHFYDVRLSFGTDSEHNPAARLEAEWHYEFKDRWTVNLKGLVHRSDEWDANGVWVTLQYRF